MWSLFKIALVLGVLVVGLGFALSSLPDQDAGDWGRKAAQYGIKGARGSKLFYDALASEIRGVSHVSETELSQQ